MITKKIAAIVSFCLATLVAFIPFNYIVGSKFAWFSCATFAIPALGSQCSLLYVIFYIFTKALCGYKLSLLFLLRKLPLVFATLVLQRRHVMTSVVVPILAMILFCAHPVGSQVFYYSWYWFIPMILYWFIQDSFVARALSASFVAHAVGSVVWLYAGTISAQTWHALIPLVVVERLLIAAGMIVCVYALQVVAAWCQKKVIV
jgi:hypothetical protein